jgi:membrane associated rhomboid family serine protease
LLFEDLTLSEAETVGLVLSSEGISFRFFTNLSGRFEILVWENDLERALQSVEQYYEENEPTEKKELFIEKFNKTTSGLFVSLVLFYVHSETGSGAYHRDMVNRLGSSAEKILDGEIFRCSTALFIHADYEHLLGNMAGIGIFCTAVVSITGIGTGWFMILCSGIIGNFLNALFYKSHHVSIGASTAVFGAIGILGAFRTTRLIKEKGLQTKAFLPMGAGLSLLALLGSSEYTDITAHLFGYMTGSLFGIVHALSFHRQIPDPVQSVFLFITTMIIAASWYYPFYFGL